MRRYARKVDANQAEIKEALEGLGCTVEDASGMGKGFPDLVVGYRNRTFLLEVIGPDKLKRFPPDGLTEDQREWHASWRGHTATVYSVEDAKSVVGVYGDTGCGPS